MRIISHGMVYDLVFFYQVVFCSEETIILGLFYLESFLYIDYLNNLL
jgi:hypothetical protein